ncbi:preprotein translocase subunit SecD [Marinitoga sp. 1135]|uniref:protein translocase subunit SecD n=1 Tax=unclassified Marinitoga TaxID=2640159 RepID=UPI0009504D13|nr:MULTISPECIES: protein translocase subunit SecD [unclassified Marinitoga]APT76604.1 preprotein translocase subunit SecD [Marinitoga sp. 1137]NUU96378.1 preprotein translocase subunit SecD [Marinitoga sp. 1135]NUU98300.1 preprotein translocase subunit SecD [Marinitoga sp. 1138]
MKAHKVRVTVSVLVFVAALLMFFWPTGTNNNEEGILKYFSNIKLGLDIKGGSMLEYDMKLDEGTDPNEIIDNVILVLRKRLDAAGYTEAVVSKVVSGNKIRVRVEIPGITDIETAEKLIGSRGKLYFAEVIDVQTSDAKPEIRRNRYVTINGKDEPLYDYVRDMYDETTWYKVQKIFTFGKEPFEFTGTDVVDANADINTREKGFLVNLKFSSQGSKKFELITGNLVGKRLAIILDNRVIIAPVVNQKITSSSAVIEGIQTIDEARNVAALIKAGNLPVDLVKFQERTTGPTLGKDVVETIVKAGLLGLAVVMVYMIVFYGWMGVVADIALIFNSVLLLGVLAGTHAILTLPGLAGIILTFGTTVDGNVIIYERIKEELRHGRPPLTAVRFGFDKAFWTLFDANLTTVLAGVVLYYFATGTVRGFAITLIIGVLGSMFTNLVVSRSILETTSHLINVKKYQKTAVKEGN